MKWRQIWARAAGGGALLFAVFAITGCGVERTGAPPSQKRGPNSLVGKPAPKIDIELLDGGKLDLASMKDKNVVILDFWATWCGPCVEAMPVIDKVAGEFESQGVRLFAVNVEEDAATVRKFLDQRELEVAVALDSHGATAKAYQVSGIPQTVLIGKDGTVQVVRIGFSPSLESELKKDLTALVAGADLAAQARARATHESEDH